MSRNLHGLLIAGIITITTSLFLLIFSSTYGQVNWTIYPITFVWIVMGSLAIYFDFHKKQKTNVKDGVED